MALPQFPVVGPTRIPLSYGLFTAVPPRDSTDERWVSEGVEFTTLGKLAGQADSFADGCTNTDVVLTFPDSNGFYEGSGTPFGVQATFVCSPVGVSEQEAQGAAQVRLVEGEEMAVESAFSAGTLNTVPTLTSPTALTAQKSVKLAVAVLEQAGAEEYGTTGVIHMNRTNAALALECKIVESRGGRLHTVLGTPVVAGSGYDFDDIRMSPPMFAYRTGVFTYPVDQVFDRKNNRLQAVADRYYVLGMDEGDVLSVSITE